MTTHQLRRSVIILEHVVRGEMNHLLNYSHWFLLDDHHWLFLKSKRINGEIFIEILLTSFDMFVYCFYLFFLDKEMTLNQSRMKFLLLWRNFLHRSLLHCLEYHSHQLKSINPSIQWKNTVSSFTQIRLTGNIREIFITRFLFVTMTKHHHH